ncbi:PH domain-containing protein [Flagellimonas flava]|uniref:PH domain-containing protein n=1 Tax=Flagellimonas flava TaxID=570519 RepID=A0A1M5M6S3_9FLAO|nr:PH domain-containing protein [Allomuricauda flava]SHG72977.1 PH domain-containing protein [Allomuricauda flava]
MKKYPSKIGIGLLGFILVVLIGSLVPVLSPPIWPAIGINLAVLIFILYLFATTHYTIDGNWLHVQCGFLVRKKIDIGTIIRISETSSLISGPAVSLDRLNVVYGANKDILISPKDKSGLIEHLRRINPEIEVRYKTSDRQGGKAT